MSLLSLPRDVLLLIFSQLSNVLNVKEVVNLRLVSKRFLELSSNTVVVEKWCERWISYELWLCKMTRTQTLIGEYDWVVATKAITNEVWNSVFLPLLTLNHRQITSEQTFGCRLGLFNLLCLELKEQFYCI